MRVTDKIRYALPQAQLARLQTKRLEADEQVSSGKRLNRPSDDPLAALKVERFQTQERQNESWSQNIDHADTLLHGADGALTEAMDTLQRVKELAIQGINSSLTQADADELADEVTQLREHLKVLANTRVQNRYLFGGGQIRTAPYDDNYAFQGDTQTQELDIADGLRVAATVAGGSVFGDGTANTVDVFKNLDDLQTEIRARNENNMQTQFDLLEKSLDQVTKAQTDVGLRIQRADAGRTIHDRLAARLPADRAALEDADLPTAITTLTQADNAYQAALAAGAKFINGTSLLDFLR
jgi:flagellar hook-associated protein 3 FlgL